jgi:hypothetical protein
MKIILLFILFIITRTQNCTDGLLWFHQDRITNSIPYGIGFVDKTFCHNAHITLIINNNITVYSEDFCEYKFYYLNDLPNTLSNFNITILINDELFCNENKISNFKEITPIYEPKRITSNYLNHGIDDERKIFLDIDLDTGHVNVNYSCLGRRPWGTKLIENFKTFKINPDSIKLSVINKYLEIWQYTNINRRIVDADGFSMEHSLTYENENIFDIKKTYFNQDTLNYLANHDMQNFLTSYYSIICVHINCNQVPNKHYTVVDVRDICQYPEQYDFTVALILLISIPVAVLFLLFILIISILIISFIFLNRRSILNINKNYDSVEEE